MNLTDFSNEILMQILCFVPDKSNVALTCKRFYEIVCKLQENQLKIDFKNENFVSEKLKSSNKFNLNYYVLLGCAYELNTHDTKSNNKFRRIVNRATNQIE
jgi:hypothetical protein